MAQGGLGLPRFKLGLTRLVRIKVRASARARIRVRARVRVRVRVRVRGLGPTQVSTTHEVVALRHIMQCEQVEAPAIGQGLGSGLGLGSDQGI